MNGFAAICADGSVVTWGASDNRSVQERLRQVHQIQGNLHSFAAILEDGFRRMLGYGRWR